MAGHERRGAPELDGSGRASLSGLDRRRLGGASPLTRPRHNNSRADTSTGSAASPGTSAADPARDLTACMRGLAEMYVADVRFAANYGGVEDASFVRDALLARLINWPISGGWSPPQRRPAVAGAAVGRVGRVELSLSLVQGTLGGLAPRLLGCAGLLDALHRLSRCESA